MVETRPVQFNVDKGDFEHSADEINKPIEMTACLRTFLEKLIALQLVNKGHHHYRLLLLKFSLAEHSFVLRFHG